MTTARAAQSSELKGFDRWRSSGVDRSEEVKIVYVL